MTLKRYTVAVVVLLAVIGAVLQQQTAIPNQEIVLELNAQVLNIEDTQGTIHVVEDALSNLGATHVKIKENANGKLKISYHSATPIGEIKQKLSKRIRGELGLTETTDAWPLQNESLSYNLDVYEIQNTLEGDSGVDGTGTTVLELETKGDRFSKPNSFSGTALATLAAYETYVLDLRRKTAPYGTAIALQNALKRLPEGRAGPRS
jgi:outer membrane lipoprotein-sorting protein